MEGGGGEGGGGGSRTDAGVGEGRKEVADRVARHQMWLTYGTCAIYLLSPNSNSISERV